MTVPKPKDQILTHDYQARSQYSQQVEKTQTHGWQPKAKKIPSQKQVLPSPNDNKLIVHNTILKYCITSYLFDDCSCQKTITEGAKTGNTYVTKPSNLTDSFWNESGVSRLSLEHQYWVFGELLKLVNKYAVNPWWAGIAFCNFSIYFSMECLASRLLCILREKGNFLGISNQY